jgi:peptide-methionine (S)-S-oxide reductase
MSVWRLLPLVATLVVFLAPGTRAGAATSTGEAKGVARATFAGGCFWCMEPPFEALAGVISVTSGYSGGMQKNPTYEAVSAGRTGHAESVQIVYDPMKVTLPELLDVYWHNVDPTSGDGQFCDRGKQYRPAIFYNNADERRLAQESRIRIAKELRVKKAIMVQIVPLVAFYPAEEYHQDYYKKNPEHYHAYRTGCGRDRRLRDLWGEAAAHH